jgi:hypothetical protein
MRREVFWCAVVFAALSEIAYAVSMEVCQRLPGILTTITPSGTQAPSIQYPLNACGIMGGRCPKSEAGFGCDTGANSVNRVVAERVLTWILHEQLGSNGRLLPDNFETSVNALYLDAQAEKVDALTSEFIQLEPMPEPSMIAGLGAVLVGIGAWIQWQPRKFKQGRP